MRILVTGGCGFVGSHLCARLISAGHEVVVLDTAEKAPPGVEFVRGDIRDEHDVVRAIRGCETVFHLAAIIDVRDQDADRDYAINCLGAKTVFQAAMRNHAKIIFTSSAAVYGSAKAVWKEDDPCEPISQYGKSKLAAEKFLVKSDESAFVVRPFNIYGPGAQSVVTRFCRNALRREKNVIYGDGRQTRDYVFVDDVVDALVLGLGASGVYNVGTGTETQLLQLIDMIDALTGSKPELVFELAKESEVLRSRADITKIRGLGWEPKVELMDGLRRTLRAMGWAE